MRNLEDLVQNMDINHFEPQQKPLSKEEQERITALVLQKAGLSQQEKGKIQMNTKPKKRIALIIAAAAIAVSTISVGAAAYFNWDSGLESFLKPSQTQKDMLAKSGTVVNQTDSSNGLTLNVKQAMSDRNSLYLIYDITLPKGITWEEGYNFSGIYLQVEGSDGLGYGCTQIGRDEATNTYTFVLDAGSEGSLKGKQVNLQFMDFGYLEESGDTMEFKKLVEGSWKASWKLDYQDITTSFAVDQGIELMGSECTVKELAVSPLSLSAELTGKAIDEMSKNETGVIGQSTMPEITGEESAKMQEAADGGASISQSITFDSIKMKDGTIFKQGTQSSFLKDGRLFINYKFDKLIDPSQVESVTIGGVEIPLS